MSYALINVDPPASASRRMHLRCDWHHHACGWVQYPTSAQTQCRQHGCDKTLRSHYRSSRLMPSIHTMASGNRPIHIERADTPANIPREHGQSRLAPPAPSAPGDRRQGGHETATLLPSRRPRTTRTPNALVAPTIARAPVPRSRAHIAHARAVRVRAGRPRARTALSPLLPLQRVEMARFDTTSKR